MATCPQCKAEMRTDGVTAWCVQADCEFDGYLSVRKKPDPIGGLIVVSIDGYSGKGAELVRFEPTATGIKVTLRGALALALQISDTGISSYINAKIT